MRLADLLSEALAVDCDELWEDKRTSTPVRVFGVRRHSMSLFCREIETVVALLGGVISHGAVWKWMQNLKDTQANPTTGPSRVAADEKQIELDGKTTWL